MSLRPFRIVALLVIATLCATVAFTSAARAGTTATLTPDPFECLLDDPKSCSPQLPPDDGSDDGDMFDLYCEMQRALLGDLANTPLGRQRLEWVGC
jgi:hypothetical protein